MHHQDAIAHPEQLRQLRRNHDDPGPARGQPVHQVVDLDLRADIDPARRLVEDEHPAGAGQPFPEHDLLLVAAAQQPDRLGGRRLHAELVADRRRHVGLASPRQHAERCQPPAVRQRDVARDGQAGDEPLGLAILREQADPARDRVGRVPETHFPAVDQQPSLVEPIGAGDHAGELRPPGTQQAGNAEHLTGMQREADVRQHAANVEPFDAQQLGAALGPHLRKVLGEIPVRHQPHELRHGDLVDRSGRDMPPVAHHGDPPSDPEHLVEPVRDVDDGDAAGGKALDEREELRHLTAGERRRRLVHDEHLCVVALARRSRGGSGQSLGNLHHLPLRETKAADRRARIDGHAEVVEQRGRALVQRAPVDDAAPACGQLPQEDVLGDREVRDEVQLLVDDADPEVAGVARAANLDGLTIEADLAGVLAVRAAEDLHQRRLPGAVLAEQHVDVAGVKRQVDVVERDDAGKHLPDAAHLEHGRTIATAQRTWTSNGSPPGRIVCIPSHFRIDGPGRSCSSSMNILLMRVS